MSTQDMNPDNSVRPVPLQRFPANPTMQQDQQQYQQALQQQQYTHAHPPSYPNPSFSRSTSASSQTMIPTAPASAPAPAPAPAPRTLAKGIPVVSRGEMARYVGLENGDVRMMKGTDDAGPPQQVSSGKGHGQGERQPHKKRKRTASEEREHAGKNGGDVRMMDAPALPQPTPSSHAAGPSQTKPSTTSTPRQHTTPASSSPRAAPPPSGPPPPPTPTPYPGPLNSNSKPIAFLREQTLYPSKTNYIGGNLTPHILHRSLIPMNMPPMHELRISVLVYSVNRKGPMRVFLRKGPGMAAMGGGSAGYDLSVPETKVFLDPDDEEQDEGQDRPSSSGRPAVSELISCTVSQIAYSFAMRDTGVHDLSEMDVFLLPMAFGGPPPSNGSSTSGGRMILRAIAMFKSRDLESEILPRRLPSSNGNIGDGGWLSEDEARRLRFSIGGGLVMRREIVRGFNILEADARGQHDKAKSFSKGFKYRPVMDQLVSDATIAPGGKDEEWLPGFGPVGFIQETYRSINEFLWGSGLATGGLG